MENKKEIDLDEVKQNKEEESVEVVEKQQESIEVLVEEVVEETKTIETNDLSENKEIEENQEAQQTQEVLESQDEQKEEVETTQEEISNTKTMQEDSTEIQAEQKHEKMNIKDSLMKAADQIKDADVYGQIKKSGLYGQLKEMFIKIKQNDYEFTFSKRDKYVALGIIFAVLFFDQITKIIASNLLMEYESYEIIDHFFYFTFIYNPGMAWGTFEGMRWLFVIITPLILLFILHIFVYSKKHEVFTRAGMILVIAGAIGNWIDRLFIGEVRDFIHFIIPIIEYDFPIFNIADIAVVVGMGLVVLEVIIQEYQIWKLSKSL